MLVSARQSLDDLFKTSIRRNLIRGNLEGRISDQQVVSIVE